MGGNTRELVYTRSSRWSGRVWVRGVRARADTYVRVRRRGGAARGRGLLPLVGARRARGQVDRVRFGVRPLRALAQLQRQPPAQRRRHALRLTQPAPPLTPATGMGIRTS